LLDRNQKTIAPSSFPVIHALPVTTSSKTEPDGAWEVRCLI
jgi:hypothetical protein